jgi:membrane protease subunit (stomatin/prohibitin family)
MELIDVIKYNGGPDVFAWKFPSEELGTWSQLIVNESQEAVLFKGGQALDVFAAGRHTLETKNIPILNKLINLPFGGQSPFTAEVWYVNRIFSLDIKWGTASPIQLQDPKYNVFVPVRAFGQFGIQIGQSKTFLTKLVGTLPYFDESSIRNYFRGLYVTKVKDAISSYLVKKGISILEINAYLDELSEHLKERMSVTLYEYGINLVNFYVNDINVPEDDPAVTKLKDALAKKAEMDIIGYSYIQERSFDTLEGAATNKSSGQAGLMGAGMGLGMGVGLGGAMGGQFGGLAQQINIRETKKCGNCGNIMDIAQRYCPNCGHDAQSKPQAKQKESVVCGHCGAEVSDNSKYCSECGKPLFINCSKCGCKNTGSAKFCNECGNDLRGDAE